LQLIFGSAEKHAGANKKKGELQPKFVKAGIYVERTAKGWRYKMKGASRVISGEFSHLKVEDALF
jgi:formylmethanofuran dehydrogenase subunit C